MERYVWLLAIALITVPAFAQDSDEAVLGEFNAGARFALGNLALRDLNGPQDPVQQLKAFFVDVRLPLAKEQERKLAAVIEDQQKGMRVILERRDVGGARDSITKLNQDYLKRVNGVLMPEQQRAWRHYRIEQIRLRGGFPALQQLLEQAGVPLAAGQGESIRKIFENFDARRDQLTKSNVIVGTTEMDALQVAEFHRVVALLTPEQRQALQASRSAASYNAKR